MQKFQQDSSNSNSFQKLNMTKLTLCLDKNLGGKEKERNRRKGREGKEKEGERIIRKAPFLCLRGNGKERKRKTIFLPNLYGRDLAFNKIKGTNPFKSLLPNPFPPNLSSYKGKCISPNSSISFTSNSFDANKV